MLLGFATIVCCSICQKKNASIYLFIPIHSLCLSPFIFVYQFYEISTEDRIFFGGEERDKFNMSEESSVRVLHFNVIDTYRVGETIQDDLHSFIHFSLLGYSK